MQSMSRIMTDSKIEYDKNGRDSDRNNIVQQDRSVDGVITSIETTEGEGITISRSFPTPFLSDIDPFLLLDEFGPQYMSASEMNGLPAHPHRGFETVTYMLEGKFELKDSRGNAEISQAVLDYQNGKLQNRFLIISPRIMATNKNSIY
jgi:hypothetical protein